MYLTGAALALLDSVYLPLHLPSNLNFRTVTYGLPRVRNSSREVTYAKRGHMHTYILNRSETRPSQTTLMKTST